MRILVDDLCNREWVSDLRVEQRSVQWERGSGCILMIMIYHLLWCAKSTQTNHPRALTFARLSEEEKGVVN